MAKNTAQFDPRKYLGEATQAMKNICLARYEAFGTAGWADKIRCVPMEDMFKQYESGDLDPRVAKA